MDKLKQIINYCECGVFITVNEHRNYYQTAEERLHELYSMECPPNLQGEVYEKMIAIDTIVEIQFYPDTPIGSYSIYHYDLDSALNEALEIINTLKNQDNVSKSIL